ncbi:hypothetical protein G7Z17_g649 [Cylindrodendrum hubeiense]|uniref:Uncharacterized protein n=1 Tax=Cylindrodendrum hubeiense TaxID=595255 RepID=A0A9P5HM85_9HYPO|nr:hypothetical protein G7Z17_g649 [Cylindrodendrum hubeiense]
MLPAHLVSLATTLLLQHVHAATQLSDSTLQDLLNQGGSILAETYGPVWNFDAVATNPSCYPTWAFGGNPNQHNGDVYDSDHQSPGGDECQYPNVGCNCRTVGASSRKGPQFPIYYTYNKCSDSEVRVSYNLFYEKDGFNWLFVHTGHPYDWENVIVSITRDDGGNWNPTSLLLGGHGTWWTQSWNDLYTVDRSAIDAGENLNLQKANADHPMVYPSWAKHANFPDPSPWIARPLHQIWSYQSTCNAIRGTSVWAYTELGNYVRADRSTEAGQAIDGANWGGATGTPVWVHYTKGICAVEGNTRCGWGTGDEF